MKINNIRIEYLSNPIGIDITSPRIRWTLEGLKKQTAFEIIYSLNDEDYQTIKKETNDMFYDFEQSFTSRDIVKFKIRVTSDKGEQSEYSEEHSFEIGLLNKTDWTAKWIAGNYKTKKSRYLMAVFHQQEKPLQIEA